MMHTFFSSRRWRKIERYGLSIKIFYEAVGSIILASVLPLWESNKSYWRRYPEIAGPSVCQGVPSKVIEFSLGFGVDLMIKFEREAFYGFDSL